jgi:CRISPR-associated endonuclease Cas1
MSQHPSPASDRPLREVISLAEVFDREPRDPSILVVDGYGLRIHVERGHLMIQDGIGTHRRTRRLTRIERTISRLLILGHTGSLTLDALAWCHNVGIAVTQLDPATGQILMAVGSTGRDDPRLRRAQALAQTRPVGLAITRTLIGEKVSRQARVLMDLGETRAAEALSRDHHALASLLELKAIAETEARAANAYFAAWIRQVKVTFAVRDVGRVPHHWTRFDGRRSVIDYGRSARKATSPVNAILNYCYALAEAECRIALVAVGLDPGLGILHTDKNGRDSLALDIIEPVRPIVDRVALDVLATRRFRAADFHQTPAGHCRLLAPLTHDLADHSRQWRRDIAEVAEYVANSIANDSSAPIPLRTPLTGSKRLAAARTKSSGRRTRKTAPAPAPQLRTCRDCGAAIPSTSRLLCSTCWPVTRNAQLAQRTLDNAAKRAAQRAAGHDPTKTPEARAKQRATLIADRVARAEWERANVDVVSDPATYWELIQPQLSGLPLSQIVKATGVSSSGASKIRSGKLLPHPRHWQHLSALGGGPGH